MAVINYESLDSDTDVTTTRTLLHEAIPLTGTIVSGTYGTYPDEENIKNYTHGMFQTVYDYPYLSSSANHILDITACYAGNSGLSSSTNTQNAKKINQYTLFAQTLMEEVFVVNFSRLLTKDQIKKGSFSLTLGTSSYGSPFGKSRGGNAHGIILSDASASTDGTGTTTVLGGDMGLLYSDNNNQVSGAIFYQAGIAVITASAFYTLAEASLPKFHYEDTTVGWQNVSETLTGSSITGACDALRHRIGNISFNNTTEINSKIYFCRVPHNKYNYSSNPTYVSGSKIRVKNVPTDNPVAYITTVGLYNESNELLATAKLSEPLRKDPTNDITIRVRLDY